jgi:hypothetical protein
MSHGAPDPGPRPWPRDPDPTAAALPPLCCHIPHPSESLTENSATPLTTRAGHGEDEGDDLPRGRQQTTPRPAGACLVRPRSGVALGQRVRLVWHQRPLDVAVLTYAIAEHASDRTSGTVAFRDNSEVLMMSGGVRSAVGPLVSEHDTVRSADAVSASLRSSRTCDVPRLGASTRF